MTTMIVDDLARIPMSPYLTATLTRAADYASAQAHREVTLEHLLLALAEDPEATVVLKASHIDLDRLTAEVSDHLGRDEDRIDPASGQNIALSADLRRILEAAAAAARQGRRREINGAIVLAAIVGDGKSPAAHMLRVQGLTFEEAIRALQYAAAPQQHPAPGQRSAPDEPARLEPPARAPDPIPEPRPGPVAHEPPEDVRTGPPTRPPSQTPPHADGARPLTTEEILAAARERLQARNPSKAAPPAGSSPGPAPLPRANYPDRGGSPEPAEHAHQGPDFSDDREPEIFAPPDPSPQRAPAPPVVGPPPGAPPHGMPPPGTPSQARAPLPAPAPPRQQEPPLRTGPPTSPPRVTTAGRRRAGSGPFVGSWPLIEAGQLVENIPRRMRVGIPMAVEARIARADVKALSEGLAGGGGAFRHEIVVTKAMSVRLRAPGGGFVIENRSPETQWIENVLGLGNDDYASWRWTVTPMARGRRQLQLIVSARTVGADGVTAETALPDQIVDVKIAINYTRTALKWAGWIGAAVIGGLLAKFGETAWVVVKIMFARALG